jgi:glycosyltransferase involved in cell wall biosynthesis
LIIPENVAQYFDLMESDSMANAISNIIKNPDFRLSLKSSAMEWAQLYTYENRAARYVSILELRRERDVNAKS